MADRLVGWPNQHLLNTAFKCLLEAIKSIFTTSTATICCMKHFTVWKHTHTPWCSRSLGWVHTKRQHLEIMTRMLSPSFHYTGQKWTRCWQNQTKLTQDMCWKECNVPWISTKINTSKTATLEEKQQSNATIYPKLPPSLRPLYLKWYKDIGLKKNVYYAKPT